MYPRWLWAGFALPGVVWLLLLFLVPFYAVIGVAFGNVDALLQTAAYRSGTRSIGTSAGCSRCWATSPPAASTGAPWCARSNTSFLSLFFSVLIGYPVAYYIARHAGRTKNVLLILLIMPFWISYLMRMLAWVNLLAADGYATRFFDFTHAQQPGRVSLGLLSQHDAWLNGQSFTVIAALVYGYIPYLHPAAVRLARPHRQEPARSRP